MKPKSLQIDFSGGKVEPLKAKLFSKRRINGQTGCWEWTGASATRGYGGVRFLGKDHRVHRLSFALFKGPIPEGIFVCHHCDNRRCFNPDHLFLGTALDNERDKISKGRNLFGEKHLSAKMTEEKVLLIRSTYRKNKHGHGCVALGRRFGLSQSAMHKILSGQTWAHLLPGNSQP